MITNGKRQDKGKPIFGLQKLPDSVLLKASRREVGELKAYVDELEDKCAKLEEQLEAERKNNAELVQSAVEFAQYWTDTLAKLMCTEHELRQCEEKFNNLKNTINGKV